MKVIGKVPMIAGSKEIFAPDVASKFVGKRTGDGGVVLSAEQTNPNVIWLTIEFDLMDDIFKGKEFLVFGVKKEDHE